MHLTNLLRTALLLMSVVFTTVWNGEPPQEREVVDLTSTEPTEDQIIDALKSSAPEPEALRARGMQSSGKPTSMAPLQCEKRRGGTRGMMSSPKIAPGSQPVAVRVQFASGSSQLLPQALKTLETLGRALSAQAIANTCIQIEGHTDDIGTEEYNQGLSWRRAEAVLDHLVTNLGIDRRRLIAAGLGERDPLVPNASDEARAKNRRVQVLNLGFGLP